MKIVLLPGLDGTGEMFEPILPMLSGYETLVLPLPASGAQDYETLASYMQSHLPDDAYVLLAESFSGPIAVELASKKASNLKAVILVTTFLSPPSKYLLMMSKITPFKLLVNLPFIQKAYRALLFGRGTSSEIVNRFGNLIRDINPELVKKRLNTIKALRFGAKKTKLDVPTLYLQASDDRLVDHTKVKDFESVFESMRIEKVKGPHFLLQGSPQDCAARIEKFISNLVSGLTP